MTELGALLKPGESIRPIIDVEECKILVEALYGLECCAIVELNGYDDKNYKVHVNESSIKNKNIERVCRDGYVLKILNSLDSKKIPFVEAQTALTLHLRNNGIKCPKPVKNRNGNYHSVETFVSGAHVVRLLEFLPGSILNQVAPTPRLLYQTGKYVALLDSTLQKFHHPAYDCHHSLWMLDSMSQLSQFSYAVTDLDKRQLVENVIRQFTNRVLSVRQNLEKGIIHGDFNEQNIVVDNVNGEWDVKGVLDFGDTQFSCYLYELAVVITYMIIVTKDLDAGGYVIAGYSTIRVPSDLEFALLKICVAGRMVQSLVMGAYTILQDPGNAYTLSTAAAGWELLQKLWAEPDEKVLDRWKTVSINYNYVD